LLFNTLDFAIFLTIVFILYWFFTHKSLKSQNLLLVIASYIFYGWWDWRFLFLLFFISASNFVIAIQIQKEARKTHRKLFFISGLLINIGTLVLFKYFNFFTDGFINLINLFGFNQNLLSLNIILPLGISFYIFLSLSYLIDVYQDKLIPVRNIFDALLTFSFFPIILAGPIQRPISLLPQIQTSRIFNYAQATDGLRQILWGVFMKIVIADRCSSLVNDIFTDSSSYSGSTLILGVFLFTIQIYADFGGYSNIAIGVGKLLGFNLMQNFAYPYFARDIREFWRRWNISLTTWFRDYIFLPIAYSLSRKIKSTRFYLIKTDLVIYIVGISITWMLTGLWHGANYTFIIWGAIQGFLLILYHLTIKPKKRLLKRLNISNNNSVLIYFETLATFIIIMFSWIFFRADNVNHAWSILSNIFSSNFFVIPQIFPKPEILLIFIFLLFEWIGRDGQYGLYFVGNIKNQYLRYTLTFSIAFIILLWGNFNKNQFIYFQF
jgi:alginate O-acetyltransferase complex protein AlgI